MCMYKDIVLSIKKPSVFVRLVGRAIKGLKQNDEYLEVKKALKR